MKSAIRPATDASVEKVPAAAMATAIPTGQRRRHQRAMMAATPATTSAAMMAGAGSWVRESAKIPPPTITAIRKAVTSTSQSRVERFRD